MFSGLTKNVWNIWQPCHKSKKIQLGAYYIVEGVNGIDVIVADNKAAKCNLESLLKVYEFFNAVV